MVGGALDTEALVLLPGKWVWRLSVALTVLDQGGNLLDACVFAAVAALRHYRKPHADLSNSDDQAKLGAEAFAFVNFARFAVPLRIGLALSTTPWIQDNIVDRFMKKDEMPECEPGTNGEANSEE